MITKVHNNPSLNQRSERDSNFELLRLLAMWFILTYHLISFFIVKLDDNPIYKTIQLPLHVAVICFVLISGYFHIKTSLRGLCKLILPLIIIYLPLTAYAYFNHTSGVGLMDFMFFSHSPYWFIRAYACLFLMAPVLNWFLTSNTRRIYFLIMTGFLSIYLGLMREPSLGGGKNFLLFSFLYAIGDYLRENKSMLDKIKTGNIVLFYCLLNVVICTTYYFLHSTMVGKVLWNLSFPYCSPLLILNALLLFLIFSRVKIKSKSINWLSASVFAVYVIHQQPLVLFIGIQPFIERIYELSNSMVGVLSLVAFFSLVVLFSSILIDKILNPITVAVCNLASKFDKNVLSRHQSDLFLK